MILFLLKLYVRINMFKLKYEYTNDKKYRTVRDHCHYTGKYRGAVNSICNLKYSSPKEILVVFHNGSNFDYNVTTKELGKEFEEDIHGLGENNKKYKDFSYPITRELVKMDRKLQKTYLTNYDLLKVQDLCLAHYQTLLLISLK